MKGKVVSINKIMNGSVHSTWVGQNGTFYRHTLTVSSDGNTLVGEASTKNPEAAYAPGDEIEFEFTTDSHGSKFKGIKKIQNLANDKIYGPNMEHIARQNAINLALELIESLADSVDSQMLSTIADKFNSYINKNTEKAEQYARSAALHFTIKAKKSDSKCSNTDNWKSLEELIKAAEKFEAFIINGDELPNSFSKFIL